MTSTVGQSGRLNQPAKSEVIGPDETVGDSEGGIAVNFATEYTKSTSTDFVAAIFINPPTMMASLRLLKLEISTQTRQA
jgi:hypothetical protein